MFIYTRWYIRKRTSETGVLKETNIKIKKWITEVNLSITEINAVTDRNLSLVEDKIKQLNEIIEETDNRISVYVKEVEKSKNNEALYTQLGRGVRTAINNENTRVSLPKPVTSAPMLSVIRPELPVQETFPLETAASGSPLKKISVKNDTEIKKPQSKKQIREYIDKLANEGLSEQQIASELNISTAEVELAMQLRRVRKN